MNRTESVKHFEANYFNRFLAQALESICIYYNANKQIIIEDFYLALRSSFDAFQSEHNNGLGSLSRINISQVLSSLACNKKGEHVIQMFRGEDIKPICSVSYDSNWIFQEFIFLYDNIIKESRKYVGKIHSMDLRRMILENLYMTNGFLEPLIHFACKRIEAEGSFSQIVEEDKCLVFQEVINMHWSPSSRYFPMYVFDTTAKTDDIIDSIRKKENPISLAAYRDKDLSSLRYDNQNLILCSFQSCDMRNMTLRFGYVSRCRFNDCDIMDSDFSHADIAASSFTSCRLNNSIFEGITAYVKAKNRPDSIPLDFSGSNLENVSFKNAILTGANFLNTTITNADFSGANLDNAVFLKEMRSSQQFSDNQKQRIQWI